MSLFSKEPAILIGAIMSALALAVSFGLKISGEQINLINSFLIAAMPLISGLVIRSQVVPTGKADAQIRTAVRMPEGTSVGAVIAKTERDSH